VKHRALKHRTTDPACMDHREPRNRLTRWWYDRNRGRSCEPCMSIDIRYQRTRRAWFNHEDLT
jgi:hypothetical protein